MVGGGDSLMKAVRIGRIRMVTNEMLRCIAKATGHNGAIAKMGRNEGGEVLKVIAGGREVLVRIDKPFSEDPQLAVAIVRHLLHTLAIDIAHKHVEDLKGLL